MIPVVALMGYLLFDSVYSEIQLAEEIKKSEVVVVDKLKTIRLAEKAFKVKNGYYTADWDSLVDFVKNGDVYIIEKKEEITPRDRTDPDYYKGDIIEVLEDTIGVETVMAKIFPKEDFPDFNPDRLPYIPATDDKKFDISSGKVKKGIIEVSVLEVIDNHPMDKTRTEEHPSPKRWPLRFGSKTDVTLSGNWE
ncbi:MAG: hypothetical protein ACJAWV_000505 [Flammeovirgaceae bacterium]|jgi:hypothetical protein